MKFIPILFSTEMVKAEQAGRKTQTRRTRGLEEINENPNDWYIAGFEDYGIIFCNQKTNEERYIGCPYGQPGDILWVRETFQKIITTEGENAFVYKADDDFYKDTIEDWPGWSPNIHMPKAACRTFLLVKSAPPQRLNTILSKDCIAEGIEPVWPFVTEKRDTQLYKNYLDKGYTELGCVASFASLWESINGPGSWEANPWVWAIEFERTERPEGFLND